MSNEGTKQQIRTFLENAIEKAKNPDMREQLKKERQLRAKKISLKFGL